MRRRRGGRGARRRVLGALQLIPRLHERRLLGVCWLGLRQATLHARASRAARHEHADQLKEADAERNDLIARLAAAEETAQAAVTAAAAGQEAAKATAEAAAAQRQKFELHAESAASAADTEIARERFASESARLELQGELERTRAESEVRWQ